MRCLHFASATVGPASRKVMRIVRKLRARAGAHSGGSDGAICHRWMSQLRRTRRAALLVDAQRFSVSVGEMAVLPRAREGGTASASGSMHAHTTARAESLTRQLGRSFRRCHRSTAGCLTSGEIAEKLEPLLKGFEAAKAAPAVVEGLAFKLRQLLEESTG